MLNLCQDENLYKGELLAPTPSLSAIILAGGQSRRMGQDKALILIQGVPLLQRTCSIALSCTATVFVVTSRLKTQQPLIPAGCRLVAERVLPHQFLPQGPLVGFAQGLALAETEWVLLLACDLPFLQAETLQRWRSQLVDAASNIAVLPQSQQGWEPLCGFYRTSCLSQLQLVIQQGERSFQRWLARQNIKPISFSSDPAICDQEHKMLFNCNTPEELAIVRGEAAP